MLSTRLESSATAVPNDLIDGAAARASARVLDAAVCTDRAAALTDPMVDPAVARAAPPAALTALPTEVATPLTAW